ncbi:unnamed protein product [Adineta steineri]|uniref:AIG1-type G domain-containing protein n=1 Tax=Adineta steineri TaxID=433720 RepID=A0A819P444_9BILA|nr:unnamed protein product [Adineta steineri]CAF4008655.1 unnamed protein product [Adineta steineri]
MPEGALSNRATPDPRQPREILPKQAHAKLDSTRQRDHPRLQPDNNIIRLILLGKTGHGKSSLGNLLIDESGEVEYFEADNASHSVTKMCAVGRSTCDNKSLIIIDTPGFIDTKCKTEEEKKQKAKEITKSIQKTLPGPHAFLIVMKLIRFTPEELQAIVEIKKVFGPDLLNNQHCHDILEKDSLDRKKKTIQQWVTTAADELKDLLNLCGNRYMAVNNIELDPSRRQQMRLEVLQMVMDIREKNSNAVFTSELLEKIDAVIKKNKEGMRRRGGNKLPFDIASTGEAKAGAVVEIIQDDEVDREAQAIVEEQVLHMGGNC